MDMREVGLEHAIQGAGGVGAAAPVHRSVSPDARAKAGVDDIDLLRSHEYDLLAVLLGRAPNREALDRLAALKGDASALGLAHLALADAAAKADPDDLQREFF